MRKTLDVILEEESHIYSDSQGYKYDSATTIIGKYKEPFDPYKIMKDGGTLIGNYVKKYGETEEYWLAQWNQTKEFACKRGTAFHKVKENLIIGSERVDQWTSHHLPFQNFKEIIDRNPGIDYSELPNGVYPELTLFNRRFMISGQADKIVIEYPYFDIDDYKTNGEFKTEGFKAGKFGKPKMMYYPVNKFQDCHLYHYTLQLSLYAWMLVQFGLIPRRLRLLHYGLTKEDSLRVLNGENISVEPTEYIVKYEEKAVEAMINHFVKHHRK